MTGIHVLLDNSDVTANSITLDDTLSPSALAATVVNPDAPLQVLLPALTGRLRRIAHVLGPLGFASRGEIPSEALESLIEATSDLVNEALILANYATQVEHAQRRKAKEAA